MIVLQKDRGGALNLPITEERLPNVSWYKGHDFPALRFTDSFKTSEPALRKSREQYVTRLPMEYHDIQVSETFQTYHV